MITYLSIDMLKVGVYFTYSTLRIVLTMVGSTYNNDMEFFGQRLSYSAITSSGSCYYNKKNKNPNNF